MDGIVGVVGQSRGVISFDNHATAGVVDVSVPVESMIQVAPWDKLDMVVSHMVLQVVQQPLPLCALVLWHIALSR